MPESAIAEPPSPPPAPPAPSPSPPISVTPAAIDKGPAPPPPKPGSARERMFGDLRKKAGMEDAEPTPPAVSKTTPEPEPEPEPELTPEPATGKTPAPEPSSPADKKKVSPWKLVDEHKAARLKAETEIAELRKTMADPAKVKAIEERAAKIEARAKELEEEIRYVNYSKSKEFQEKYQQPYEDSWKKWMGELGELTVADGSGNERPLQPQDLLDLVNMPLGKAREHAVQVFGDFADDVMGARKEIRGLFESQNKALEEARKGGELRQQEMQKQFQLQRETMAKQIGELWTKSNELAQADERVGKFFKPVEGDQEINGRLKKGFEIADRAFSVSPLDPNLTPDQRQQIVQLHSAVRNRAAAFGRLVYQNEKLESTVAELTAELAKFKNAQPGAGEPRQTGTPGPHSARDDVFGALHKLAR